MRKYVLLAVMIIAGSGNAMAYDWGNAKYISVKVRDCLGYFQQSNFISKECQTFMESSYESVLIQTRVESSNGVPVISLNDMYMDAGDDGKLSLPSMILPVSKGVEGNYVLVTASGKFVRLDDDDPLKYKQKGNLSNLTFLIESLKGRPPTFVEKLVGEVIMDKDFPDYLNDYKKEKKARIEHMLSREAKVKIFGLPLYSANQKSLLETLKKNKIEKIGAIHGYSSDIFNTSKKVKGTTMLDVFYNHDKRIGRLVYHFKDLDLNTIIQRFSWVYGTPIERSQLEAKWVFGRITINLKRLRTDKGESITANYLVWPFIKETLKGNFEKDHLVDANAF